jgi:peptidoglycan/xylan/chitin deacetylase (PgdA/CDA1 family)
MAKEILVGFDVDAVAGWLGSYGGEDSPDDISRGLFAGEVGSPRLVKLFDRLGITTTWFIPGHSIETFPEQMKAVADAGHEIGIHGYSHENPIAMTREQETAILDKCIELVTKLSGKRPTGYVAPWWEFSTVTNDLLLERRRRDSTGWPVTSLLFRKKVLRILATVGACTRRGRLTLLVG